jgi:hypothetical protein
MYIHMYIRMCFWPVECLLAVMADLIIYCKLELVCFVIFEE